jgi:tetratricopeptide (TPR) repeat protein
MEPDDPQELLRRATAAASQRDFEQALVCLKRLLTLDDRHELAVGMLASVYAELRMPERAIEYYRRALEVNPANPLARLQLGLLQSSLGRAQDALDTWRPSLDDPKEFVAHFQSGVAMLQLQRPAEARSLLATAEQRMPANHPLRPTLRELLTRVGQSTPTGKPTGASPKRK